MADCPSGQWERTVNPSVYTYPGSNPGSATPGPLAAPRPGGRPVSGPGDQAARHDHAVDGAVAVAGVQLAAGLGDGEQRPLVVDLELRGVVGDVEAGDPAVDVAVHVVALQARRQAAAVDGAADDGLARGVLVGEGRHDELAAAQPLVRRRRPAGPRSGTSRSCGACPSRRRRSRPPRPCPGRRRRSTAGWSPGPAPSATGCASRRPRSPGGPWSRRAGCRPGCCSERPSGRRCAGSCRAGSRGPGCGRTGCRAPPPSPVAMNSRPLSSKTSLPPLWLPDWRCRMPRMGWYEPSTSLRRRTSKRPIWMSLFLRTR